ncbi:MAG: phasin family protein [Burkholderiaceae bacterium]
MLEAGIKALTLAKERTTSGAGNVVASLMDPFGFRKLEEVFDQRVASALERLGVPSARSLADLVERMEKLCERVEQLEAARRKK